MWEGGVRTMGYFYLLQVLQMIMNYQVQWQYQQKEMRSEGIIGIGKALNYAQLLKGQGHNEY